MRLPQKTMHSTDSNRSLHIACPHCTTLNRVPSARLTQQPKCGLCHRPLFTAHPIELTAANFDVHAARSDIPLVVDFWALWCGPCRVMAPAYEQAAPLLEPQYRLGKLDSDAEPLLATRYHVRSIPTLMLLKNGRELARQAGAVATQDIVRWVRAQIVD